VKRRLNECMFVCYTVSAVIDVFPLGSRGGVGGGARANLFALDGG